MLAADFIRWSNPDAASPSYARLLHAGAFPSEYDIEGQPGSVRKPSAVVGGCAALVAIIFLKPREYMETAEPGVYKPRFEENGAVNEPAMCSDSCGLIAIGSFFLWIGWLGFDPAGWMGWHAISGDTGSGGVVGVALVNTVLAPSAAGIAYVVMAVKLADFVDLFGVAKAILTGLVSISAGCSYVQPWAAVLIGAAAAPVYIGSSLLLKKLKLDDAGDMVLANN